MTVVVFSCLWNLVYTCFRYDFGYSKTFLGMESWKHSVARFYQPYHSEILEKSITNFSQQNTIWWGVDCKLNISRFSIKINLHPFRKKSLFFNSFPDKKMFSWPFFLCCLRFWALFIKKRNIFVLFISFQSKETLFCYLWL